MTQRERDRLVALRKADKKLITQKQAAQQIGLSERQLRRLLVKLRKEGDQAVIHAARGRASNRKISSKTEKQAVAMLSRPVYAGFGPTLAAEYLEQRHGIRVGRETLRGWMSAAGLWKPHRRKARRPHLWRERRSRRGELLQWDTSEHDLDSALSHVEARRVANDYTIRFQGKRYQIDRKAIVPGPRGGKVRLESRLDEKLVARCGKHELAPRRCLTQPESKDAEKQAAAAVAEKQAPRPAPRRKGSDWMKNFDLKKSPPLWLAAQSSGGRRDEAHADALR